MEEKSKEQFKWKFYLLSVQLNAVILLVAIAVIGFFLVPNPYRFPLICLSLIIAILLAVNFVKKYRETKAWLDVHGNEKKKKESVQE